MMANRKILAAAIAAALLWPASATFARSVTKHHPTRLTVHPRPRFHHWRGYGFLPGYRPQLAEINGLPVLGPDPRPDRDPRFVDWYGEVHYGWGRPGFHNGRWNGGSYGPCWTDTPIGKMWNCGP